MIRKKKYRFTLSKYYWLYGDIHSPDLPDLEVLRDYFKYEEATKSLLRLRDANHKRFVEPRVIKGKIYALYDCNQNGKILKVSDIITALTDKVSIEKFEKEKAAERKLLRSRTAILEKAKKKERHKLIRY